eukprot:11207861-Lingulodinium_polyedra.AAC.1
MRGGHGGRPIPRTLPCGDLGPPDNGAGKASRDCFGPACPDGGRGPPAPQAWRTLALQPRSATRTASSGPAGAPCGRTPTVCWTPPPMGPG